MGIFLVYKFPLESETSSKRLVGGIGIDITEQKQTEDALKKSEEKFRQIVDTTYEGVWIVDTEAKTVFVNRRTTEMMGYAESEMMGRPTHDFVDEEMSARVEANLKRRRQGITEQYDFRLRRKDGSDLWVIVSASPLQDEKGEFYSTLTLLTDITERKKAEETRSFLASIVHSSNDAIISFDFFRQIVSWNDSAAKIFGYTAEEIIGQPLSILAPRELQQEQMEITEKIWRGETVQQYET